MSSLRFLGNDTSYLQIPNTDEFDFGTGDFTIEWYQYQIDNNPFPRIFQVGSHSSPGEEITIGVSIERVTIGGIPGGDFYYWPKVLSGASPPGSAGTVRKVAFIESASYKNTWVHFAICRSSNVTKVFMNGVQIGDNIVDENDYNGISSLAIANQPVKTTLASFGGYMTYFAWVKGIAKYTTNFTVSNDYPALTPNHTLLLTALDFTGVLGGTVDNQNVGTVNQVPPGFGVPPLPPSRILRKPMYSDNSLVFYKTASLAAGGIGSVRNASIKSRRI